MHSQNNNLDEIDIPKEKYISPEKRQPIIHELRLTQYKINKINIKK